MARTVRQDLPSPPAIYDQAYIAQLAEAINRYMSQREAHGELITARMVLTDTLKVPGDVANVSTLPTGEVYQKQAAPVETESKTAGTVTGTASTAYVMAGLDLAFTSEISTQMVFTIQGQVGNTQNGGETDLEIVYGTGTAPVNGAAPPPGAVIATQTVRFVATSGGGSFTPFTRQAVVTGLTLGTAYWVDIMQKVTAGTSILTEVGVNGFGLRGDVEYYLSVVNASDP